MGTTAVKIAKKRAAKKPMVAQPHLIDLYFTKTQSSRPVDSNGMPTPFDPGEAVMVLTVSLGCNYPSEDNGTLALVVDIEAEARRDQSDEVFYSAEVHAIGIFNRPSDVTQSEMQAISKSNIDHLRPSFNTIYAVAVLELARLIEKSGLPPPAIPMSLDKGIIESSLK